MANFGEALRKRRERVGMTRRGLAEAVGVTSRWLLKLERRADRPKLLPELAEALGTTPRRLAQSAARYG